MYALYHISEGQLTQACRGYKILEEWACMRLGEEETAHHDVGGEGALPVTNGRAHEHAIVRHVGDHVVLNDPIVGAPNAAIAPAALTAVRLAVYYVSRRPHATEPKEPLLLWGIHYYDPGCLAP